MVVLHGLAKVDVLRCDLGFVVVVVIQVVVVGIVGDLGSAKLAKKAAGLVTSLAALIDDVFFVLDGVERGEGLGLDG